MFILLSAILHLTNIKFLDDDETDGVYINDEYPLKLGKLNFFTINKNYNIDSNLLITFVFKVSRLLALDQEALTTALISTYTFTRCEYYILFFYFIFIQFFTIIGK